MLFLLFHVGNDRFVVETSRVVEVLPLVYWKHVPDAPRGVVGLMSYHGVPVPVVDLAMLILDRPTPPLMSTRMLVVEARYAGAPGSGDPNAPNSLLALIAEHVTGTFRHEAADFVEPGDVVSTVPYLGSLLPDDDGFVQQVRVDYILSPQVHQQVLVESMEIA